MRTRKAGDRFQPLGMEGTKKLKEFMIDAHIPRAWRDGVPLVVGKEGVAWVVGWRIAHWARVTPETQEVVEIAYYENNRWDGRCGTLVSRFYYACSPTACWRQTVVPRDTSV